MRRINWRRQKLQYHEFAFSLHAITVSWRLTIVIITQYNVAHYNTIIKWYVNYTIYKRRRAYYPSTSSNETYNWIYSAITFFFPRIRRIYKLSFTISIVMESENMLNKKYQEIFFIETDLWIINIYVFIFFLFSNF
jgi:hypothetical protein